VPAPHDVALALGTLIAIFPTSAFAEDVRLVVLAYASNW
jgi:hypothetical protein